VDVPRGQVGAEGSTLLKPRQYKGMDGLSGEVDTVARESSGNIQPSLYPWNKTAA
jgi:hypothetical protein